MEYLNSITSCIERTYLLLLIICGVTFFIAMFVALGELINYVNEYGEWKDITWLIAVDVVLIISCFDIFCCPFCRKRASKRCKARRKRTKYLKYRTSKESIGFKKFYQMAQFQSKVNLNEKAESLLTADTLAANDARIKAKRRAEKKAKRINVRNDDF